MSRSRNRREDRRRRRQGVRRLLAPKLPPPLMAAWRHARWAFVQVATLHMSPRDLALCETISRQRHRTLAGFIRHLELLARRLVLVAALALNLVLRPVAPSGQRRRPRLRRRIVLWPGKPETWHVTFRIRPPRAPAFRWLYRRKIHSRMAASLPLARRLEAVRRVLVNPDRHIRRCALRFARLAETNRVANQPRHFAIRPWSFDREGAAAPAAGRIIASAMAVLQPMAEDAINRFNQAADPG